MQRKQNQGTETETLNGGNKMRIDEIESRKAEIRTMLDGDTSELDIDALTEEVRSLDAEKAELESKASKEAELRSAVAPSVIAEIKESKKEERKMSENIELRNRPEYIHAFAESIRGNDAELRALLKTENATNGTVPVPEMVYDIVKTAWDDEQIMGLVKKTYIKGNLKVGFERSAGAAYIHTEGGDAITSEDLSLGTVSLIPQTIKKKVSLSDEVLDMDDGHFLDYIYREIAHQIAKKAADTLIGKFEALTSGSTSTAPAIPVVEADSIAAATIATAIGNLSDEAANPVIIMNKGTFANFKSVQYGLGYGADIFEGLPVVFNNTISTFAAATSGVTYAYVADLGHGVIANFPNGEGLTMKVDDLSDADADLVNIIGRMPVAMGVVAEKSVVKIAKVAAT